MTNGYFNHTDPLLAGTVAKAVDVNNLLTAVAGGFDKLPAELELKQDRVSYGTDSGAANVYVVALPYAPAAYVEGLRVRFKPLASNTGPATVNVNGLGAKAIKRFDGSSLEAGDLSAGSVADLTYNGTDFRLSGVTGTQAPTQLADGTAGVPALRFNDDPDTGLYRIGANNLGIAVGGAKIVDIAGDGMAVAGRIYTADGSAAAPAIGFVNDTDCGVYRIGANNLGVAVAGAKVLDISATGLGVTGLLIAGVASGSYHTIARTGVGGNGTGILALQDSSGELATFQSALGASANAANSTLVLKAQSNNSRSLGCGGTGNFSGADPAEYHYKAAGCPAIAKGQVVGLDADDRITDRWAAAVDFAIKSTDPSTVGGDRWDRAAGDKPVAPAPPAPAEPLYDLKLARYRDELRPAYEAELAAWEARYEAERQKVDRLSHGGGRLPAIVEGPMAAGDYVVAAPGPDGGIIAVAAASVAEADRRCIVGRVRVANPDEARVRQLVRADIAYDPRWTAIVVQMKG